MKKLFSILTLAILCNILPAEEYNTYNPVPVKLKQKPLIYVQARIAKLLDGKDDSFAFVFVNHRQKVCNIIYSIPYASAKHRNAKFDCLQKDFKIPAMRRIVYTANINSIANFVKEWRTPFALIFWILDYSGRKGTFDIPDCNIWNPSIRTSIVSSSVKFHARGRFKFKIFKLVDGKDASFALVAINDSKQEVKIPGILSPASKIKIKFPDGKIFTYFDKSKGQEALRLKPGESKYIKFDIYKLLDKTNEFSPDSFNYGMSELIWEVTMPDKSIITNSFYLLKTEKPLPEIAKTKGYLMDVNKMLK